MEFCSTRQKIADVHRLEHGPFVVSSRSKTEPLWKYSALEEVYTCHFVLALMFSFPYSRQNVLHKFIRVLTSDEVSASNVRTEISELELANKGSMKRRKVTCITH